jgi:anthranilate phosphoribosyltransferase
MVVHGSDGLDEITITGESKITELKDGQIKTYTVTPEELGLAGASLKEIQGGDARRNGEIILEVLGGRSGAPRDVVLANAAAAIVVSNRANDFREGVRLAADSIDSGRAMEKLQQLIEFTREVSDG